MERSPFPMQWDHEPLWAQRRAGVSPGVSPGMCLLSRRERRSERGLFVRRKDGGRKGIAISQRGSAGPTFLRDKSRAPCQFLARTVNTCPFRKEEREKGITAFELSRHYFEGEIRAPAETEAKVNPEHRHRFQIARGVQRPAVHSLETQLLSQFHHGRLRFGLVAANKHGRPL